VEETDHRKICCHTMVVAWRDQENEHKTSVRIIGKAVYIQTGRCLKKQISTNTGYSD